MGHYCSFSKTKWQMPDKCPREDEHVWNWLNHKGTGVGWIQVFCILYSTALTIVHLNWTDKKCLGLQFNAFFSSCYALETWSKLSREKFYINDWSDGNQNFLRVRERFDLSRIRVIGSRLQCCMRFGSRGPNNFVSETTSKCIEGLEFFIKDIMIDQL